MRIGLRPVLPPLDFLAVFVARGCAAARAAPRRAAATPLRLRIGDAVDHPRPLHVEVADADAPIDRLRLEQPDEVLEIADRAGAELPAEIDGKLSASAPVARSRTTPWRSGACVDVEAEAGEPAAFERRHEERAIGACPARAAAGTRAASTRDRRSRSPSRRAARQPPADPSRRSSASLAVSPRLTCTCAHAQSCRGIGKRSSGARCRSA